ncbi:hypothetical protein IV102_27095 [bacterium]|nr:hypothetical protein [bacterium]
MSIIAPTRLRGDKQQEEELVTSSGRSHYLLDEKLVRPRFASPWRALPSRLRWPCGATPNAANTFATSG